MKDFCKNTEKYLKEMPFPAMAFMGFQIQTYMSSFCEQYPSLKGVGGEIKDLISAENLYPEKKIKAWRLTFTDIGKCKAVVIFELTTGKSGVDLHIDLSCPKSKEQIAIEEQTRQTRNLCEAQKATCHASCPRDRYGMPDNSCANRCNNISCN